MSDDTVSVYIEDYGGALGPAAYRLSYLGDAARSGLPMGDDRRWETVRLPSDQVERWERAEAAWEAAQAEMRQVLKVAGLQRAAALAQLAGIQAAQRMMSRSDNRRQR